MRQETRSGRRNQESKDDHLIAMINLDSPACHDLGAPGFEIRSPKAEARKKAEIRSPHPEVHPTGDPHFRHKERTDSLFI
jgi:hypothetical protein